MTSGGDAPGMNAAVKVAHDTVLQKGYKPYLIYRGLTGLVDDLIEEGGPLKVSGIMCRGGTVLGSAREPRFFDDAIRKQAYENLKRKGISKLIVVGGDGSFRALNAFYNDFGVPFAGIPATIDNDIYGTDYCLGVDSASNIICRAIDDIRDTASSFRRAFVVEVMGRDCGYLAMTTALASGAEVCLVPEIEHDIDSIGRRILAQKEQGRDHFICVVAEGCNMGGYLSRYINDKLKIESRLTVLGHIQRGGAPSVHDRVMAYRFAVNAVDALLEGKTNAIMTFQDGSFDSRPIGEIAGKKFECKELMLQLASRLSK